MDKPFSSILGSETMKKNHMHSAIKLLTSKVLAVAAVFVVLFGSACDNGSANEQISVEKEAIKNETTSADLAELTKLINIPVRPISVIWDLEPLGGESLVPGPMDQRIIAILEYSPGDIGILLKKCSLISGKKQNSVVMAGGIQQPLRQWFPQQLKQMAKSNGGKLSFSELLDVNCFANTPYNNGFAAPVPGTNFVLLELHTQ